MQLGSRKMLKKAYIFIFIWSFYSLEPKFFKRVSFTNYWEVFASITILLPFLNSIYYLYLNFHLPWKYWISFLIFQMKVWFMGTIHKSFFLFKSYHLRQIIWFVPLFFSCASLIPLVIEIYPGSKLSCGLV